MKKKQISTKLKLTKSVVSGLNQVKGGAADKSYYPCYSYPNGVCETTLCHPPTYLPTCEVPITD